MRVPLSFRAVEETMLLREVQVSYETIRCWRQTFGQQFANELRRRPQPGDKWHWDEVLLKINGQTYDLWRAVGQDGCAGRFVHPSPDLLSVHHHGTRSTRRPAQGLQGSCSVLRTKEAAAVARS